MINFRKILVPVDFSEHSKLAAKKAISLAQTCQATLYFLHVGETAKKSAEVLCQFINDILPKTPVNIQKLVAQGTPASMILSTARKLGADTIIMGHRGLSGLKHLVQGSVAEKVLRESLCPVLIIKKTRKKLTEFNEYVLPQLKNIEETFQLDKILVPLDFSPASKQAFRYAVSLASHYNSTIYTLTVFDKKYKELADDHKRHTTILVRGEKIQLWKEFPELLQTASYDESETRLKRILLDGDPSSKIESLVQKKEIDLVIMGTNGRTGLEYFLLGSVAEKVLKSVDCPVMTIRVRSTT
jgi:nucleotide-binding universal stress UspA family protein